MGQDWQFHPRRDGDENNSAGGWQGYDGFFSHGDGGLGAGLLSRRPRGRSQSENRLGHRAAVWGTTFPDCGTYGAIAAGGVRAAQYPFRFVPWEQPYDWAVAALGNGRKGDEGAVAGSGKHPGLTRQTGRGSGAGAAEGTGGALPNGFSGDSPD